VGCAGAGADGYELEEVLDVVDFESEEPPDPELDPEPEVDFESDELLEDDSLALSLAPSLLPEPLRLPLLRLSVL
jgi:hypothetical protein